MSDRNGRRSVVKRPETSTLQRPLRIALAVPTLSMLGQAFLRYIARHVRAHEPWALFHELEDEGELWTRNYQRGIRRLRQWNPDAVITRELPILSRILELGKPVLVLPHTSAYVEGTANLVSDDRALGRTAFEHLASQDYPHLAFCGDRRCAWSRTREDAFTAAAVENGYEVHVHQSSPDTKPRLDREKLILDLGWWLQNLTKAGRPLGMFCATDRQAWDAVEACHSFGLHVPDQVGVLGANNNSLLCELSHPPISSIAYNTESVIKDAIQLVSQMAKQGEQKTTTLVLKPTHVVTRASTEATIVGDAVVAEAIKFIRGHVRTSITSTDVARAVHLSERSLRDRFKRHTRKSVAKWIRQAKAREMRRLLAETNYTIAEVGRLMGIEREDHVGRFLKQETGQTPSQFRQKLDAGPAPEFLGPHSEQVAP